MSVQKPVSLMRLAQLKQEEIERLREHLSNAYERWEVTTAALNRAEALIEDLRDDLLRAKSFLRDHLNERGDDCQSCRDFLRDEPDDLDKSIARRKQHMAAGPDLETVEAAHDEFVFAMSDEQFRSHQSDCAMCADFGRPE